MTIGVPREARPGERRVALIPAGAARLIQMGAEVAVEAGAGQGAGHPDRDYREAGAQVVEDRLRLLTSSQMVLRLGKPPPAEVDALKEGTLHIGFLEPFDQPELIERLAKRGVDALCMEMIPRSTRAQKMDALSSQANLAGYVAVVMAAARLGKLFPMMTTPAGTISPARVFVIGAGVAGLQAIATAKRLGARVEAYDTRPVVEEQVRSLGARFVRLELGETGQTREGYAKALTEEQLRLQRDAMARVCAKSDVVVTTAQIFGRKAPLIVTAEMVAAMSQGSVVVDMAVESGGNVQGSRCGEVVDLDGVTVVGLPHLSSHVPVAASQVYSSNLTSMIQEFWDKENRRFKLDLEDEIIQGCLVVHNGEICNERLRSAART